MASAAEQINQTADDIALDAGSAGRTDAVFPDGNFGRSGFGIVRTDCDASVTGQNGDTTAIARIDARYGIAAVIAGSRNDSDLLVGIGNAYVIGIMTVGTDFDISALTRVARYGRFAV